MTPVPQHWQIPAFTETVLHETRTPYCLVIPVINEGERIRDELRQIHHTGVSGQMDVILADGGSTDGSLDLAFLKSVGVSALLTKTGPGRLSAQLRMGYAWALARGYEGIVTIDGNGKDSVDSIPLFVEGLNNGVDYVQASRFITGGNDVNAPLMRVLAIRLIHAPCISLAARHWFTDTTQGFRAYSRRYLLDERVQPFRDCFQRYELLAYLSVRATQIGYKVQEVPTTRSYPATGTLPTKISPVHGSVELLRTLFSACLGNYNP